jgi:hypothetical protein
MPSLSHLWQVLLLFSSSSPYPLSSTRYARPYMMDESVRLSIHPTLMVSCGAETGKLFKRKKNTSLSTWAVVLRPPQRGRYSRHRGLITRQFIYYT